jgi:membrane protease YdiL (CAAX protease family)
MLSKRPWQPELVLMFIAALFASLCLAGVVAPLLQSAHVAGFKSPDDTGYLLLGTLSMQGVTWVFIWFFLKWHEINWRDAFGLNNPDLMKSLLLAAGVLILALPVVWLLQSLSITALARLGVPPENQRAVDMLLAAKSVWAKGYFVIFAVVIAPVAEEFIFRGMLYPFVKQLGSPKMAFFGTSAIFAEIHFDAGTLVPLFALALVLTWLYKKTDCLMAPVAAHSLFNATNLVVLHFEDEVNELLQRLASFLHGS